jgi:murein DD-endopeptidase MepM/ murein hydrolase activator NlpD
MKWKIFLLITIFVPSISFAGFGDNFNLLLERFFSGTEPNAAEQVLSISEPEVPLDGIKTPEDVKKAILQEEDELQSIEESLYRNEKALSELKDERNLAKYQLEQLDADLGAVRSMQEVRNTAVVKWQRELEGITRKKAEIEASVRYEKGKQEELFSKKFMQSSLQGSDGELNLWNWVFSNKSISQLIEKRRREQQNEELQTQKVQQLQENQLKLAEDEQRVAAILFRVQELERQSSQQQMLLADLVSARANVSARLEFSQGELENAIDSAREQQAQSTITLQGLREKLTDNFSEVVAEPQELERKLSFPLPTEAKVTAHFLDPEYKKNLGRDHFGTDFVAQQGTNILAPADGVIKKVAQNGYAYSYFIIDHGNDLFTLYGHVSDVDVKEGDLVVRGQEIAKTGGTPGMPGSGFFTTGPHLHFEVFAGGRHVDAEKWLDI